MGNSLRYSNHKILECCFFLVLELFVFFCYGQLLKGSSRTLRDNSNNFNLNGFQTVYFLCKDLHFRCYKFPGVTLFYLLCVVSGTNRLIISLINLCFFGIIKSTAGEVVLLGAMFKF